MVEGLFAALELLGLAVKLFEEGFEVGGRAEEVLEGFTFDRIHERDEKLVGFVFVLDERILLALGAQANAFAEGIHAVEVLLPLLVDSGEHHATFLLVEDFGGE